ncbi:MAG: hypothetical protein RMK19_00420 [Bacteroidia bacterium]|nr:hypothetical protein [Bacteroidia bacterium]MDW8014461.1 hypothetical protein [Bacteroidia bacterium]
MHQVVLEAQSTYIMGFSNHPSIDISTSDYRKVPSDSCLWRHLLRMD